MNLLLAYYPSSQWLPYDIGELLQEAGKTIIIPCLTNIWYICTYLHCIT